MRCAPQVPPSERYQKRKRSLYFKVIHIMQSLEKKDFLLQTKVYRILKHTFTNALHTQVLQWRQLGTYIYQLHLVMDKRAIQEKDQCDRIP